MSSGVKVAVRVRPFNSRNAECIVKMSGNKTLLVRPTQLRANPNAPPTAEDEKSFTFDHSYWSFDSADEGFASQNTVFNDLGSEVLQNAWEGFNCSIFAYGQTGSGKSYSMLGYGEDKGIIPLVCEEMFNRIGNTVSTETEQTVFKVEVSFMEIYNERVKDLLNPKNNKLGGLKVRNNPSTGPYVEDLSKLAVKSFAEIEMLMDEGSKARTVASTNMNATSSRSHAVFTIVFTQSKIDKTRGVAIDRVSKVSLVDLAGSERAASTGATGVRLKEGANINKSLSTLGKVISALAENSSNPGKKQVFVPYRDSVLTYLLKESLGGNSKTIMIAAISPADINYEETLSTLRYADSAKKIKTTATVNEDPQSKVIRELQSEVERLRSLIGSGGLSAADAKLMGVSNDEVLSLNEKIEQYEKLMAELNKSWEEKLSDAERIKEDRMSALKDMGVAIKVVSSIPHLINLNEDPLMSESLVYYLREGITKIGRSDSDSPQDIILNGLNIAKEHCVIENKGGVVIIIPPENKENRTHSSVFVNGIEIATPTVLTTGNRVILGNNHIFRFNHPEEAAKIARERGKQTNGVSQSDQIIDYDFALKELASAQGNLALTRHFGDNKEFQKQMKVLYDQMRKKLELDFDPEARERREKIALLAIRRWRSKVYRSRLLSRISQLILSLNEANAISETFAKNIELSLKLYSIFPQPDQLSDSDEIEIDWRMTQIGIKVNKKDTSETTMISNEEFMDRTYSMRELYQNDGKIEQGVEDPFQIQFNGHSLIGVSHIYLKNILYLVDISRPVPILDSNGSHKGYLNIKLSPKVDELTEDDIASIVAGDESFFALIGKKLDLSIHFNGITDFKESATDVFSKFQFDGVGHQTHTLKEDKVVSIASITDENINYFETQYIAVEIWGKRTHGSAEKAEDALLKAPLSESFEFLASVNILEPQSVDGETPIFKPVHILEDSDTANGMPSVTFRLRKEIRTRQIVLKCIKSESGGQSLIKACKSVRISQTRVVGKRDTPGPIAGILSASNTPSTPSTPNNSRTQAAPSTPLTPFNQHLFSQAQLTPGQQHHQQQPTTPLNLHLGGASSANLFNTTASQSAPNSPINDTFELPVISVDDDTVLVSWDIHDPAYLLNQKPRKGSRIIFRVAFELSVTGFATDVVICKDISVKILSDAVVSQPEGANTSMSNLLDKFKTHFRGESILSEPSIHSGSVFNVHVSKSLQLEHENRIGAMIDTHHDNFVRLAYAMRMERLRQELDLRQKLGSMRESENTSLGSNDSQMAEDIVKRMSQMNNASQAKRATSAAASSARLKRSEAAVEVTVNEVGSSALIKEDEMRGFLMKKSSYKDEWKPRYFVLKKPYLSYAHSEKEFGLKSKKIELTNTSIAIIPQEEVQFGFAIIQLRRVWLLQAASAEAREKWMQILDPTRKISQSKDEELRLAKQQLTLMRSQLDIAVEKQREGDAKVIKLNEEKIKLNEEKTAALQEVAKAKEESNKIQEEASKFKESAAKVSEDAARAKEEAAKSKAEMVNIQNTSEHKVIELNGHVKHLENVNENKEVQIDTLSSTIDNTNHIMELLTEQAKSYKNVAEMEIEALRQETTQLRETNELVATRLSDCRSLILALEAKATDKEQQLQYYKQTIAQDTTFAEYQNRNLQNLKTDSLLKQGQIDTLAQSVEQSTKAMQLISDQYSQTNTLTELQKGEIQNKKDELSQINTAYLGESTKLKEQTGQLNSLSSLLRTQMKAFENSQSMQKEQSATEQKKLLLLLQDLENGLNKASQTITEQGNQNITLKKEAEENRKQSDVVVPQLEQQLKAMKERLINSENQLIDRECENTLLSDKLKMWEEEIKIKDAKLGLLENNVKEVRAEYESGMAFSRELSHNDSANKKNSNRKSKMLSAEEQMDNMRESSIAHQTHNAFLNLQLQRLETEMRQQEKVYNDTISRIKKDLQQRNQQNIAFMKQQAGDEVVNKMQDVTQNYEQLKKKYFISLVVAAKLQNVMMGNICNVDAYEMYEQAIEEHVLDIESYPNWVAVNISKKNTTS
eukprot:gene17204-20503_t